MLLIGKSFSTDLPREPFSPKLLYPDIHFLSNLLFVRSEPPIHTNPCKPKPHHFPPCAGVGAGGGKRGSMCQGTGSSLAWICVALRLGQGNKKAKHSFPKWFHTLRAPGQCLQGPLGLILNPCGPILAHAGPYGLILGPLGPEVTSSIEFSWA